MKKPGRFNGKTFAGTLTPGRNRDQKLINILVIKDLASQRSIAIRSSTPTKGPNESF